MKIKIIHLTLVLILFSTIIFAGTAIADGFSDRLKGKILLQVEDNGEAWYIYPNDSKRYYLGRPSDAFNVMRTLGLGVSEASYRSFQQNNYNTPNNLKGKILLRVEANGEAYYVDSVSGHMSYLGRPKDAFEIMRSAGLGITNTDLNKLIIGEGASQSDEQSEDIGNNTENIIPQHKDFETKALIPLCTLENKCERYKGVSVYWTCSDEHLPASWKVEDGYLRITCEPLTTQYLGNRTVLEAGLEVAKKAIDKYPEGFLSKHLDRVYMTGGLRIDGKVIGGTINNVNKSIFITVDSKKERVEQTFHHELSSILFWDFYDNFDVEKWKSYNKSGFKYGDTKQITEDEELLENGFVRSYGMDSVEQDINVTVPHIFKRRYLGIEYYDYWKNIDSGKYPRLEAKFNHLINFYHQMNPLFTESYFRQISQQ